MFGSLCRSLVLGRLFFDSWEWNLENVVRRHGFYVCEIYFVVSQPHRKKKIEENRKKWEKTFPDPSIFFGFAFNYAFFFSWHDKMKSGQQITRSMSTVDQLLEKFLPNYLEISTGINALAQQCQTSIDSPANLVSTIKAALAKHCYAKYICEQNPNFIFGSRDLEKAKNGKKQDQVEAVEWPMLPDGSTVPKQDQHSRDLRKLYKKFNPSSPDHRKDCSANNYAWLHPENIPQIVEAARQGLKGKQYREFCAKKSLEKLCRIAGKSESFIETLNSALFAAKAIFPPVSQGDIVMYKNHCMMVVDTKDDGNLVQLGDHVDGEPHVNHDTERWIPRDQIDTKLHKRPRAMSDSETEIVAKVLENAYDRAVKSLDNEPSAFVATGMSNEEGSPAEAVMFYIYLAVFFEMKTYVQDYPGVVLRRDWESVKFYNASVDREHDNTNRPNLRNC
eukprot:COSAG01_NODE_14338_length_1466_cov_1.808339_1_plen_447_part_00